MFEDISTNTVGGFGMSQGPGTGGIGMATPTPARPAVQETPGMAGMSRMSIGGTQFQNLQRKNSILR